MLRDAVAGSNHYMRNASVELRNAMRQALSLRG